MAHSDEKNAFALLFLSRVLFMIDCATAQIDCWGGWPTAEVWSYFLYDINVSRPIFVKLDNYFNPGCLFPTFVEKKLFQWNTWNSKDPPSSWTIANWLDFLSLTLYLRSLFSFFLSIFLDDKRYIGRLRLQCMLQLIAS